MSDKKSLLQAITKEEALLSRLEKVREQALSRIQNYQRDLASLEASCSEPSAPYVVKTSQEKVALFRSLFRGREDLFPKLWTSRVDKKGYSPACTNDWAAGICGKTRKPPVKCSECDYRKFLPVTDQVIMDHLQGRYVIGVYPMLPNDTCWFLAADFDKETWKDDVAAFRETCKGMNIPVAIERSRSGNGAHTWFFFNEPVAAATARTMGCYLITETMSRRHQLSMESYDRLFSSQDTLTKGGFGNLIALPFQHELRQKGNTVFLDDNFTPYADQWEYLTSITKLQPEVVQRIANEAIRSDNVLGIPRDTEGEEEHAPWNRTPSRKIPKKKVVGKFPARTHAVFAQRLFIERKDLPSPFLTRIKRLAAFQNPMFYEKQSLRLSTARIPRIISCFEEHIEHIAIPRGCLDGLEELFREHGVKLDFNDKRIAPAGPSYTFQGSLRESQQEAISEIMKYDLGVLSAPPGFGKTVIGAHLIAKRGCRTLVLVHRKELLDQWIARLSLFLGIESKQIGRIGGGKNKPNEMLDVAMIQSLVRKDEVNDLVAGYGQVIVDECHHLPAASFERVLNEVKARYVVGLTATPYRRDGHQPIIHMQCGPVRYRVHPKSQEARAQFKHKLICRNTDFVVDNNTDLSIQTIYAALVADEKRNNLILDDVRQAIQEGRAPVLLTERKEHLDILAERLQSEVKHLIVLSGRLSAKERHETMERLAAIPENEVRLIAATGRYLGEGFDDPRLDTLILAMPFSWKGTILQYAGRIHREHPGKQEVRVYDYVDANVPKLLRMHKKRLSGFRGIGYTID